jgi:hypothetical protein
MDEFTAVVKARELVRRIGDSAIPAPVEAYAQSVGAVNQALEKTAAPAPWKSLCDSHFFLHGLDRGGRIFNLYEQVEGAGDAAGLAGSTS